MATTTSPEPSVKSTGLSSELRDRRQTRLTAALVIVGPMALVAVFAWMAWRSPVSRFLPPFSGAEWILYPSPPAVALVTDRFEQRTVFRRVFDLRPGVSSAQLQFCASQRCDVRLNENAVELPATARWNERRAIELSGLQAGKNTLEVVVINEVGPPALWLTLDGPDYHLATDAQWTATLDGATECAAQSASQPVPVRDGNPVAGGIRTADALPSSWPWLVAFALLSAVALFAVRWLTKGSVRLPRALRTCSPLTAGLVVAGVLWVLLFSQNTFVAPLYPFGFDSREHVDYIQYIQAHHALPLGDEGWEMHHPPLYYLLSAGVLGIARLSASDPNALVVLRIMGLILGLGELALIGGCLGLLFPQQWRPQLVGLGLATVLPSQLALYHCITNECLLITLGTASLYVALRLLREDRPATRWYVLLGVCLGAALLTKVTALVIAGVVLLVVAGRLATRAEWQPRAWLRSIGVTVAVMLVVCGWHYGRVWAHFGTPLGSNYEGMTGYRFWEHPGYGTLGYFFRFGQSLTDPFFSSLSSVPDGLYTTFWGDGLCSGAATWSGRPPWNDELMATGYCLALLPTLLIGLGLVAAMIRLVRRPRAEWFLVLGMLAGLGTALLYLVIRYPYCGHAKSIYLLTGLLSASALAGLGFDLVTRLGRWPMIALTILGGIWAWTAYTELWIQPDSAVTQNWAGLQEMGAGVHHYEAAEDHFRRALNLDPHSVDARLDWASLLLQTKQQYRLLGDVPHAEEFDQGARHLTESILRDDPGDANALLGHAMFARADGNLRRAVADIHRALERAPDHVDAYFILGAFLTQDGDNAGAMAAYREVLRVMPGHPSGHANLALMAARLGRTAGAIRAYRHALTLQPNQPDWRADLAWVLATAPDAARTDPGEALVLARQACEETHDHDAVALCALAAAQAAVGRFAEAQQTIGRAARLASKASPPAIARRIDSLVDAYKNKRTPRGEPPLRVSSYPAVLPPQIR